jgi:hypothetical protein
LVAAFACGESLEFLARSCSEANPEGRLFLIILVQSTYGLDSIDKFKFDVAVVVEVGVALAILEEKMEL